MRPRGDLVVSRRPSGSRCRWCVNAGECGRSCRTTRNTRADWSRGTCWSRARTRVRRRHCTSWSPNAGTRARPVRRGLDADRGGTRLTFTRDSLVSGFPRWPGGEGLGSAVRGAPPNLGGLKMRRLLACVTTASTIAATAVIATPALAAPPTPPSASTAATELASLTVKAEGTTTGYSRDKFPHWHTVSGTCDTRDEVLKRDGTGVTVDSSCEPTAGKLVQRVRRGRDHRQLGRRHRPHRPAGRSLEVRCEQLDHGQARGVRQRPDHRAADRGLRVEQPLQGRQGPGVLEADQLGDPLPLRARVDLGEVHLQALRCSQPRRPPWKTCSTPADGPWARFASGP